MKKLLAILVLGLLLSGNAYARSIVCLNPTGLTHFIEIGEKEAKETFNNSDPSHFIIYQSVLFYRNIYALESAPVSGAGKSEKRTWQIDLGTNKGSLSIERKEGNYNYDNYICLDKAVFKEKLAEQRKKNQNKNKKMKTADDDFNFSGKFPKEFNWEKIATTGGDDYYIDHNTVIKKGDIYYVNVLVNYNKNNPKVTKKGNALSSWFNYKIKCNPYQYTISVAEHYEKRMTGKELTNEGEIVDKYWIPGNNFRSIENKKSVIFFIVDAYCNKIK